MLGAKWNILLAVSAIERVNANIQLIHRIFFFPVLVIHLDLDMH